MEVLSGDDSRAARIRAMLFQPVASNPAQMLWAECSNAHRDVLVAIARRGEIEQAALERQLGVDAVELRAATVVWRGSASASTSNTPSSPSAVAVNRDGSRCVPTLRARC